MSKKIIYFILSLYSFCIFSCTATSSKKYSDEQGNSYVLAEKIEELTSKTTALVLKDTLDVFPTKIFDFPQLKVLILKGNKLKTLPEEIATLKDLEILDISDNQLVVLSKGVSKLRKLRVFNASNNELYALPKGFENLNKLQELRLSKTWIMQVPKQNFENLEVLHLGTELHDSLLIEAKKLRELIVLDALFSIEQATNFSIAKSPNLFNLSKIETLALNCTYSDFNPKDFCKFTLLKKIKLINPTMGRDMLSVHIDEVEVKDFGKKINEELQSCLPNCKVEIETIPIEPPTVKLSRFCRNANNIVLKNYEQKFYNNQNDKNLKAKLIETYCLTAEAQLSINEVEEAVIFLDKAEQLKPNEQEVIKTKAFLLIFQGKLDEAKLLIPLIKNQSDYIYVMESLLSKITIENIAPEKTKKLLEEFKKSW